MNIPATASLKYSKITIETGGEETPDEPSPEESTEVPVESYETYPFQNNLA